MKILVTGAHGFVGKHVVHALKDSRIAEVVLTPTHKELDLLNLDALIHYININEVGAIIHLAALCGGIGINKDNPGRFMYENLQMGINVVEASRICKLHKLVNLSTVCSYPKFAPIPFQEHDIWNGYPEETNAAYGIAKKVCVELGIAYHKQYGLNVTNLVPVNMAGEYDHFDLYSSHVLPALIKKFENPQKAIRRVPCQCPCHVDGSRHVMACCDQDGLVRGKDQDTINAVQLWGTGSASREFLYAGDCARAIVIALEKDTPPDPINLGTGQEVTIKQLAEIVKDVGGYDAQIVWDISKPDGQPRRCLDTSKAKEILRWEATTPIQETVAKTIKWYRDNL